MSRDFTPLKSNCPVCNGARKDCRQSRSSNLIFCRYTDANPIGFKFIKEDVHGFGVWAEAKADEWSQEQREEYQRRKRERERFEQQQLSDTLSIPDRNRAIKKLHKYLGLGSKHRENLRERSLTDAQIEAGYFFSIHLNQELPPGIPANLPGVIRGKLATKVSGFACPAFDVHGRLIGWQLRVDNATDNKYRWAKGWKSSHLPNGELPLTVCRPIDGVKRPGVGLAEGLLKPFVAAQRLGQIFIGAAAANFAGSPEQFKESIDALKPETITLYPDAGAVANPHVMGQYRRTIELLSSWGYTVNVAWWGQTDKSHSDVDELTGTEAIAYISVEEFLALGAQYSGYTPSRKKHHCSGDRTISRDEWELTFGFGKRLRNRIKQALSGFKGFGKHPQVPAPRLHKTPDESFQAGQRLQTWQDAVTKGYQYILDNSAPSLGKSHAAGIALPDAFGAEKLWYISADHRNPTTGVIESNYVDLPVRHNGLKVDETRKTPNGNPFRVWPKLGEEPDTQGNCFRVDLFQKFRAKNLNVEAAETSPICATCKLAHLCKSGSGGKYGATFRGDRKNALAHPKIRAHADSMPDPAEFDYFTSGLIWDEVGTQLKPMDSITVTLSDFDQTWAELETKAPDLHEALKPLRLALRPLLAGETKQPYHGWDDAGIRALLPQKPDNLAEIISELEATLKPDLTFLHEQADSITANEARAHLVSKSAQNLAKREFRRLAHEEFSSGFQRLALNWLVPFLNVWDGERGALRCERQQLTIFRHSDRHTAVARAAKFNIFLDATITRERLALLLGINPDEIYVVEQETPSHGNLRIIQITGMGKLGKERSLSMQQRVALLRKTLSEQYPGIRFGDWKAQAQDGDGQWFVNLRGSNEFQADKAMAVFGVPYQNVGDLQALYQTLTDEYAPLDKETPHEGLQRFIESLTEAEIEQSLGRLRSHIRPNQELTFIFVGDYDLSFLSLPVEQIEAFQICPEAGTEAQITRWKILEAVRLLKTQEKKITQQAIASSAGISQPLIAKVASQFGGWKHLSKILLALLDGFNSVSNNFPALTDDEKWIAQAYLPGLLDEPPEVAVQEVGLVIRAYGVSTFLRILAASTPQTQARLLALVIARFAFLFLILDRGGGGVGSSSG